MSVDKQMPLHDLEKSNRFNSSPLPFHAAALPERSIFQHVELGGTPETSRDAVSFAARVSRFSDFLKGKFTSRFFERPLNPSKGRRYAYAPRNEALSEVEVSKELEERTCQEREREREREREGERESIGLVRALASPPGVCCQG